MRMQSTPTEALPSGARVGQTRGKPPRTPLGRERVVQAALAMFLRRGYVGTSMKELAKSLGVSAPALYWYFPSKEDLYVYVMHSTTEDFVGFVRASLTESDPALRLAQLVRAHVTWQLQQSDAARMFDLTVSSVAQAQGIPAERLGPIVEMETAYLHEVRSILNAGVETGSLRPIDVKTTAFAIITLCEYVHTWYNPQGPLTIEQVADQYEGMVMKLVGASAASGKTNRRRRQTA